MKKNHFRLIALAVTSCASVLLAAAQANAQDMPLPSDQDGTVSAVGTVPSDKVPNGPDSSVETFMPPDETAQSSATPPDAATAVPPKASPTDDMATAMPPSSPTFSAVEAPSNDALAAQKSPSMPAAPDMPMVAASPNMPSANPAVGATPTATTSVTPLPGAADGIAKGNAMGAADTKVRHSGTYYDSTARVPNAALESAGITGPRKVDPALEPGQTFVTVTDTKSATSFEGQYVAATRALKLKRYTAAMDIFTDLHRKSPQDPRILMGLALAQQGAGMNEGAIRTYEEILRKDPNNASALVNLMGLSSNEDPSRVANRLMSLRDKYPDNPGIPAQLGMVNAKMQNYPDALKYLQIAASMEPRNPSHVYNMAIIEDRAGEASKAIELYEQALQLDASSAMTTGDNLPRDQIYDRLSVLRRKV